jgi:FAD/FMN-containing dehydrogenase
MHNKKPLFAVRCLTTAEVSLAVREITAAGLPLTVRGGGHNVAGLAVADDAVLIDLSLMRTVDVDQAGQRAHAQGGCLLGDVDAATAPYGLACPAGVVSETGLGGLALGGGYGWLARKWGLTCDHIVAAEVVLADGSVAEASEAQNSDLLWALRGGGGNFGIVTQFTLRLRPVASVQYYTRAYHLDDVPEVLDSYRRFAGRQPRDMHAVAAMKYGHESASQPQLFVNAAWFGDPEVGPSIFASVCGSVTPAIAQARTLSYLELQGLGDNGEPRGNRYFTKSCYLRDMPGETTREFLRTARDMRSRLSSIDFEYLGGAIQDTPDSESAFPGRLAPYIYTASAQWRDTADDEDNIAWTRRAVDGLKEFQYGGRYVNYVQGEVGDKSLEVYGTERYRRLARIKSYYDPDNFFRGNQNIRPSSDAKTIERSG